MMRTVIVPIRKVAPKGQSGNIEYEIKGSSGVEVGKLSNLKIRFYSGVEKALRLKPILKKYRDHDEIFEYPDGTDSYITGDDDPLDYPLSVPVMGEWKFILEWENTSDTYDYSIVADLTVTYHD
jgi:hypothetical protein